MSLEDAATLETFFSPAHFDVATDSVEKRLDLYNDFRLPRDSVTQIASNAMFYTRSLDQHITRLRDYWAGCLVPPMATPWSEPFWDFYYTYDVFREAEKALKYKDAGKLPDGAIKHFGP